MSLLNLGSLMWTDARIAVRVSRPGLRAIRSGSPWLFDQAVEKRVEVLNILDRLLLLQPKNKTYRFQHFFSQRLLAGWLISNVNLKIASLPVDGMDLLGQSHSDIEKLAEEFPESIAYMDALAATKWELGGYLDRNDLGEAKQLISEAIL